MAGDEQTKSILDWFRNQHKLGIGERTAENIKCTVGSAIRTETKKITVKGKDLVSGISRTLEVDSDEIRQALAETVFQITNAIKRALDKKAISFACSSCCPVNLYLMFSGIFSSYFSICILSFPTTSF